MLAAVRWWLYVGATKVQIIACNPKYQYDFSEYNPKSQ